MNWDVLIERARAARKRVYVPYLQLLVGAALVTKSEAFTSCNIENNSLGLAIGAERMAVFGTVSAGFRKLAEIALAIDARERVAPCVACRLVLVPGFGLSLLSPLHPQFEHAQLFWFCAFIECFVGLFQG